MVSGVPMASARLPAGQAKGDHPHKGHGVKTHDPAALSSSQWSAGAYWSLPFL